MPRCNGANMRKVLELAIGLRKSHRMISRRSGFPIQDRSLKIVPHESRYLNKKEVLGEEKDSQQINASAAQPLGGAVA